MSAHYESLHFSVPLFHVHAPHFEWHRVRRPIRAALLAGAVLLTVSAAAMATRDVPAAVGKTLPTVGQTVREAFHRVDLTRHYRHRDRSVDYQHMYGDSAPPRRIEDMYAKPRPRRY